MQRPLLLLAFISCCLLNQANAQLPDRADPNLLKIAKANLKEAEAKLDSAILEIDYTDPGPKAQDRAHLVSQAAWEKLAAEDNRLTERMKQALATAADVRTKKQARLLQTTYLCNAHLESKEKLWLLYQRVGWLKRFINASENGGYGQKDADANNANYLTNRIVEPYRLYTSDPKQVRAEAISFLKEIVRDLMNKAEPQVQTLLKGEACIRNGSRDPIVQLMVMHLVFEKDRRLKARAPKYWKQLPAILKELDKKEYPRLLNVFAQRLRCVLFLTHERKAIPDDEADQACRWIGQSIIDLMEEEAPVPEHADSLQLAMRMCVRFYQKLRPPMIVQRQQNAELIERSNMVEWAKAFYMEQAFLSLAVDEKLDEKFGYMDAAEEWGKKATKQLPLAVLPPSALMWVGHHKRNEKLMRKYFDEGISRRIDNYNVFKGHLHYLAVPNYGWLDPASNSARDFVIEVANSKNYDDQVPQKAFRLADYLRKYDQGVNKDPKLFDALESVLLECRKRGKPEESMKSWKKFLVLQGTGSGRFKEALKYTNDLDGDLGAVAGNFRGRPVTPSRLAVLNDPFIAKIEDSIDDGTLDPNQIDKLIDEMALNRMELDTSAAEYVDELLHLMETIRDYESGEWVSLMAESPNLLAWHSRQGYGSWKITENEIVCDKPKQTLKWRWPCKSPYIFEADIRNTKQGNVKPGQPFRDGLWASRTLDFTGTYRSKFVFIDTNRWLAGTMDSGVYFCDVPYPVKRKEKNRVRMRVWEDYFDFTVDGVLVGFGASPFDMKGHAILGKESSNSTTTFSNVRIRKMPLPPPLGKNRNSERYWSSRIRVEKESADVWTSRAAIRMASKSKHDKAIEDYKTAVKFSRGKPQPHVNLAIALAKLGREKEALEILEKNSKRMPWDKMSSLHLAALLSCAENRELRDGNTAVQLARKVTADWRNRPMPLRILAAAQAEAGDFAGAVKSQQKIIKNGNFSVSLATLEEDLKRFQAKKTSNRRFDELLSQFQTVAKHRSNRKPVKIDQGLVAMWNFDESVNESRKNVETTVLGDARIVEGKVRGGLSLGLASEDNRFDSKSIASVVNRTAPHSVAFWILPKNQRGMILASGVDRHASLRLASTEQRVSIKLSGMELQAVAVKTPEVSLPVNQWTHVTYTYNGAKEKPLFQIYINGKPVPRKHFLYRERNMELENTRLQIGAACGEVSIGGILDELRIYNRELTPREAREVMRYRD